MDVVMTREAAIARLRRLLQQLTHEGESACRVAADRRILCGGFRHMTDAQLRMRFAGLIDFAPDTPREIIEERANAWLLSQQSAGDAPTACDLQRRNHETCRGWDEFSNAELAQFCLDLLHEDVVVIGHEEGERPAPRMNA